MTQKLTHAPWLKAPETEQVMTALHASGQAQSRFVGGCVRNAVLGKPADDIDIATQLLPEEVMQACRAAGLAVVPTGIEHGTVTVIANSKPFEVTTLRRDVTTDGRHAVVAFTRDWHEDSSRRDFTLNALYADSDGTIHDPTGSGVTDARAGKVQFIGDAHLRIEEDYLRILRFFRFSAWYGRGRIDEAGLRACAAKANAMTTMSVERIWKELKKLLAADDPGAALSAMQTARVHAQIWPEATNQARLQALIRLEGQAFMTPDPLQRLAAALPDADSASALCARMKASNEERTRLMSAHTQQGRVVSYLSMRELRRLLYRVGKQAYCDQVKMAWADDPKERTTPQWRALLAFAEGWQRPSLKLTGDQVMAAGVPAGPQVGAVLKEVEEWWIDADFLDDPLSIAERLKAVAQAFS